MFTIIGACVAGGMGFKKAKLWALAALLALTAVIIVFQLSAASNRRLSLGLDDVPDYALLANLFFYAVIYFGAYGLGRLASRSRI